MKWMPIESAPKYDGSIHVWHEGDLVEAVWARCSISKNECWCYPEDIPYHGLVYYEMRPQPKSWLPIEPPSEPSGGLVMEDGINRNDESCECGCGCMLRHGETILCLDTLAKFRVLYGYEYQLENAVEAKEPTP